MHIDKGKEILLINLSHNNNTDCNCKILSSFATKYDGIRLCLGRSRRYGRVFVSIIACKSAVFSFLSLVCFGLAGASTVLSAQYWGKRDTASIRSIYSIILKVAFVISTLMALAVLIFPQAVMGIYSNNDEIIAAGISYLRIIGFAYILFGLSNTMICCIRSIELVKISVVVNITSFCTNVFLNWVLFSVISEHRRWVFAVQRLQLSQQEYLNF